MSCISCEFPTSRCRKVKRHFDELLQDERLSDPDKFFEVNVFKAELDIITNQLTESFHGMNDIVDAFNVIQPDILAMMSDDALEKEANKFVQQFQRDISPAFTHELLSVRSALNTYCKNNNSPINS